MFTLGILECGCAGDAIAIAMISLMNVIEAQRRICSRWLSSDRYAFPRNAKLSSTGCGTFDEC